MSVDYEPRLLGSEISGEILVTLPNLWQQHAHHHSVKHLILWRHHLEGEYNANSKNHEGSRKLIKNLEDQISIEPALRSRIEHELAFARDRLATDNKKLLDSHDKLRSVENEIYHRIEEIQKDEANAIDKVSSRKLAIVAIVISVISMLFQALIPLISQGRNDAIEIAELVFEKKIQEFQNKNSNANK